MDFKGLVEDEKKNALKELISQMYKAMMKDEGSEMGGLMGEEGKESGGEEMLEALAGGEEKPMEEGLGLEDEDKMSFMKHGNKPKVSGSTKIMIAMKPKMMMKKKGKM